jgi:hypothetical protein
LYFTSLFWLGSKEQHNELIKNSALTFFFNRLIFNLLVILFLTAIIGVVNWLVKKMIAVNIKTKIWTILAVDFLIFTIISIAFIVLQVIGYW